MDKMTKKILLELVDCVQELARDVRNLDELANQDYGHPVEDRCYELKAVLEGALEKLGELA